MADSKSVPCEFLDFGEARHIVLEKVPLLQVVEVGVAECAGYAAAGDIAAKVDSPAVDLSLMDGFAVSAAGTAGAAEESPVRLRIAGEAAAGGQVASIGKGECLRIFTGAPVPQGEDAVVPVEDCEEAEGKIFIRSAAAPGEHVQPAGENFRAGEVLLKKGSVISPGMAGMLAAAGLVEIPVYRRPQVSVIAVGDELAVPGAPLSPGKIHASNISVVSSWLARFGMEHAARIAPDKEKDISEALQNALDTADAIITTGGARGSTRDLVPGSLENLGWKELFAGVKMQPGKGTRFGLLDKKPVFVLPGGPTACEIAFLQLALPGILRMAGVAQSPFMKVKAVLEENIKQKHAGWRRFVYGIHRLDARARCSVKPLSAGSRLKAMAGATCVIDIPVDAGALDAGREVTILLTGPASQAATRSP